MRSTLEFRNITMEFPGVKALDNMSFKAYGGEVLAFLGENGAGKSTLLKILYGDYQPTSGKVFLDGKENEFKNPNDAINAGISIIYQERQVVPYLSVAENIFMGNMPEKNGMIDFKTMNKNAQKVIEEFKLPFKATDKVRDLSVAYQQMVEIMKAYSRDIKVIAFDEPTASLSDAEINSLFDIIEKLKKRNVVVLYVSHRLKEIFQITERVVVFKDGKFVDLLNTKETNDKELVKLMVGRNLGDIFDNLDRNKKFGEDILKLHKVNNDYIKDISFNLRKGEVLGLAGLVGAGRTEVVRTIFGADKIESGNIYLDGKEIKLRSPKDAIELGIALCPEDRKEEGIAPVRSVKDNTTMAILPKICKGLFVDFSKEKEITRKSIDDLSIKTPSMNKAIKELSGGNQQKVILGRWLAINPKVLILDEPTKGIDVGAKAEFYRIICEVAKKGIGVIVISSELPEIIGICDRILVMKNGRITGEISSEEATEEIILEYAMIHDNKKKIAN
ncbi:L-arabinose ABC transporter ATP-binding protein AraG [Clostridium sediminicola]|uniref:sugar ABC transporter ATP-binding protein n=1 Tax=Clostridium sediminicola TaxID=3114879 RepID=UPI0031F2082E